MKPLRVDLERGFICILGLTQPGAVTEMVTPLAIADRSISGQYGIDVSRSQSVSHSNGVVRIVSLTGTGTAVEVIDPHVATASARYYRIQVIR